MINHSLNPESMSASATARARRAKKKLDAAKEELSTASDSLDHAMEHPQADAIAAAHDDAKLAERHVHEAAEELEVATQLVRRHSDGPDDQAGGKPVKHSGHGVRSLLPHLKAR